MSVSKDRIRDLLQCFVACRFVVVRSAFGAARALANLATSDRLLGLDRAAASPTSAALNLPFL